MRKIVVMEPHEWLEAAEATRNFAVARPHLEQEAPAGVAYVDEPPIRLEDAYVLSADVDEGADDGLLQEADVRGVYADPTIGVFPAVCPDAAVGAIDDVQKRLNLSALETAGHRGKGVRIAIVDTGIDGTQVNVVGGWSPWPGHAPGSAGPGHGTMCAVDAMIAAPDAQIRDYPLLRSVGGTWVAFLSDAIRFFAEIMTFLLQNPGPLVVSNSWGLFDRSTDAPNGHPQNYSANPAHPFNTITTALVASGADVLFAAGNCGSTCPDSRCGLSDRGPGNSIHGANSHPDVITVGAVTIDDDLLGYSSQGPGGLDREKPDLCGYSHFLAAKVNPPLHAGTSAACPVVAGVVAALRSKPSARTLAPVDVKAALVASTVSVHGSGWDDGFGNGIVDAGAAWNQV